MDLILVGKSEGGKYIYTHIIYIYIHMYIHTYVYIYICGNFPPIFPIPVLVVCMCVTMVIYGVELIKMHRSL